MRRAGMAWWTLCLLGLMAASPALAQVDLVVTTSDLVAPRNLRGVPMVLVQEGMTDPEDWRYRLARGLGLPRWIGNTSMTGLSHAYEAFCVASEAVPAVLGTAMDGVAGPQ